MVALDSPLTDWAALGNAEFSEVSQTVGIYLYYRCGWLGVSEVYVVSVILVNLGELQSTRMALLQQDRDVCHNENDY